MGSEWTAGFLAGVAVALPAWWLGWLWRDWVARRDELLGLQREIEAARQRDEDDA